MEYTTASFDGCDEYPSAIADKIELLGEYYFQVCEDEEFIESQPHTKDYIDIMSTCGNVLIQSVKILPNYYPMVEFAYEATLTYHGYGDRLDEVGANIDGMLDDWIAGSEVL
jgi:hypothetical protein